MEMWALHCLAFQYTATLCAAQNVHCAHNHLRSCVGGQAQLRADGRPNEMQRPISAQLWLDKALMAPATSSAPMSLPNSMTAQAGDGYLLLPQER